MFIETELFVTLSASFRVYSNILDRSTGFISTISEEQETSLLTLSACERVFDEQTYTIWSGLYSLIPMYTGIGCAPTRVTWVCSMITLRLLTLQIPKPHCLRLVSLF